MASAAKAKLKPSLRRILAFFVTAPQGLTYVELMEQAGMEAPSVTARINELYNFGWLRDSGRRRLTSKLRMSTVWEFNPLSRLIGEDPPKRVRTRFYLLLTSWAGSNKVYGPYVSLRAREEAVERVLEMEPDTGHVQLMDVPASGPVRLEEAVLS